MVQKANSAPFLATSINTGGIKPMTNQKIPDFLGNGKDLTKQRFGHLVAIKPLSKRSNKGGLIWECICDCGRKSCVSSSHLMSKHTHSCSCLRGKNFTHGMSKTSAYRAWESMIRRCENSKDKSYKNYGGRGIFVSEEFHDFQTWYEHIGPRPGPGYSQDRIDNDGNYERGNIRWATRHEQRINSRPKSYGICKQRWFFAFNLKTGEWDEDNNQSEFARRHNVTHGNICHCLHGRRKAHKGWTFQWL